MNKFLAAVTVLSLTLPPSAALLAQGPPPLGQIHLQFNGDDNYVEAPDNDDFSVSTTGGLTIAVWMRPDTLTFARQEGDGYIHWLGKGQPGQHEWVFRMYSNNDPPTHQRENRISFYVFNRAGGQGVGSYFQDPVTPGEWIHVVGVVDGERVYMYRDGQFRDSDVYQGTILPENGTAPLRMGTRDFRSFFQGALAEVRIWNRALTSKEVADLHSSSAPPRAGFEATAGRLGFQQ